MRRPQLSKTLVSIVALPFIVAAIAVAIFLIAKEESERTLDYTTITPAPADAVTTVPAASAPAQQAAPITSSGKIAFVSPRDGNPEIYVMNSDGSELTRLTDHPWDDSDPVWSPDGRRIAFGSNRDGNWEIYVMNSDGSELTRLTDNPGDDYHPAWSPDGRRIAFASERDGKSDIYMMNSDGSEATRITDHFGIHWSPVWSPDGRRIAFESLKDESGRREIESRSYENPEIYVMNSDGSELTRLTDHTEGDYTPAWSPDGRRIAFVSSRDGNWGDIYVMNSDGSEATRLTDHSGINWSPVWSPDGRRIAFQSEQDGNSDIYLVNADGSELSRLTDNPGWDEDPVWSPDGRRIAFASDRDGNWEIYVMNSDGSEVSRLTNHPGPDGSPDWAGAGAATPLPPTTETADDSPPRIESITSSGKIAFVSKPHRLYEPPPEDPIPTIIYVMNADGSELTPLTDHFGSDWSPVWSPDGRRIAFHSERDGNSDIYVMNARTGRKPHGSRIILSSMGIRPGLRTGGV